MRKQTKNKIWQALATGCLGFLLLQQTAYAGAGGGKQQADGPTCDMSSFMVLGDSIAFGYMAGYTGVDGQPLSQVSPELVPHAWPKLVANQAEVAMYLTFDPLPPDNLSVPGYTLSDMSSTYADLLAKNPLTEYVMGYYAASYGEHSSPLDFLLAEDPSTVAVMIGNNDILGAAIYANTALKTPIPFFEQMYNNLVVSLVADADRAVVTATIPDVSAIPFLVSMSSVAEIFPGGEIPAGIAVNEDGTGYTIQSTDYITLAGIQNLQDNELPLIKCPSSLTPSYACVGDILTQDELEEISAHTKAFNTAIRDIADQYANVAVMPFDNLFNNLAKHGRVIQGKKYTLEYDGGIISKDGIHPTKLGHGILANEMIRTLNSNFAADIPKLVLNTLAAEEELADGAITPPASFDSRAFEHARQIFQGTNSE
ncbi:hypothetical protein VU12_03830 [Desulfobulbus sp. US4]|nr:hypothetical protein [Desulfobulbus sp. US4]